MSTTISARELRKSLARVVKLARRGERFTVLYRSRVAFEIVPPDIDKMPSADLARDPLYNSGPIGASSDGRAAADHDQELYA